MSRHDYLCLGESLRMGPYQNPNLKRFTIMSFAVVPLWEVVTDETLKITPTILSDLCCLSATDGITSQRLHHFRTQLISISNQQQLPLQHSLPISVT